MVHATTNQLCWSHPWEDFWSVWEGFNLCFSYTSSRMCFCDGWSHTPYFPELWLSCVERLVQSCALLCWEIIAWRGWVRLFFASGLIHIKLPIGIRMHILNCLSVRKSSFVTKLDGTFCCSCSAKADGSVWNLLCCQGYKQCQRALHCQFRNASWKEVSFLSPLEKKIRGGANICPFFSLHTGWFSPANFQ